MQAELNTDRGDKKSKVRERHGGIRGQGRRNGGCRRGIGVWAKRRAS